MRQPDTRAADAAAATADPDAAVAAVAAGAAATVADAVATAAIVPVFATDAPALAIRLPVALAAPSGPVSDGDCCRAAQFLRGFFPSTFLDRLKTARGDEIPIKTLVMFGQRTASLFGVPSGSFGPSC